MQAIYTRFEPHPAFRVVDLTSSIAHGKGRLFPIVRDDVESKESDSPAAVLSSSQANALAVSAFLALNLGVRTLPADFVLLDDPLQSLDDVNLLSLADLLRRLDGWARSGPTAEVDEVEGDPVRLRLAKPA